MKKFYESPELELVKFTLKEVVLNSQEGGIGENFGNGDDPIVDDDLLDP